MSASLRAVLVGQHPSGKNQIKLRAVGKMIMKYPEASFEKWRATAYAQLNRQRGAWAKLTTPAIITVRYTPGDLLRRDTPGMEDALSHLMEWCPIHGKNKKTSPNCPLPFVVDDSLLEDWHWVKLPLDREAPRLELEVTPK